ncbi:MAG: GTPase Era [Myxococcota bacterium]
MSDRDRDTFRAGFVALLGRPNVGKSTLVNALTGEKVAIVTPKPQTTRTRITAIVNRPEAQLILVDTPGVLGGRDPLRRALRRVAHGAAAEADLTLVVAEVHREEARITHEDRRIVEAARRGSGRVVVALNKIDRLERKEILLPWMQRYASEPGIEAVVPIAALHNDGLDDLVDELVQRLPYSPALFPTDIYTDQAERFLCAELVREQLLLQTRQEVPHSAAVVIDSFEDGRDESDGMCRLEGRIILEAESQKGIVVGKGGRKIKAVSQAARAEIEELLGCKVFLRMQVEVDRDWTRSDRALLRLGIGPGVDE